MYEEAKTMFEWSVVNDNQNNNAKIRLKAVNQQLKLPEDHLTLSEENALVRED